MKLYTAEHHNFLRRLIELVKKYPVIWMEDRTHDYKRSQHLRRVAYEAIAKEMKYFSADRIRRSWTNLRWKYKSNLRRELQDGTVSNWGYFAEMDFMRDIVLDTSRGIGFDLSNAEFLDEPLDTNTPQQFVDESRDKQQPSTAINEAIDSSNGTEIQPTILSNLKGISNISDIQDISAIDSETFQNPPPVTSSCGNTSSLREFRKSMNSSTNLETNQDPAVPTSSGRPFISGPTNFISLESDQLKIQPKNQTSLSCNIKPLTNEKLTEDIIDLTDTFEIKPTQVVKAMPTAPPPPLNTPKPAENFQESHASTSASKRSSDAIADAAVSPPQKRINSIENPSEAEAKDEDYYFVMSLLPSLKKIAENKKIDLRINILKLISKDLD